MGIQALSHTTCELFGLEVRQNEALFSIIGTIYGGDGRVTFNLPDMQGRSPMHEGQGVGLTNRTIGSKIGAESVTLSSNEVPTHTHALMATSQGEDTSSPAGHVLAMPAGPLYVPPSTELAMHIDSITSVGAATAQPHTNLQPRMVINFVIAIVGIIPTQT